MKILVTGGAGYIGSVAVKELISKGNEVIVVDNLSKGKRELVDKKAKFYHIDLTDEKLEELFKENKIDAVIHFAAYKAAGESMFDAVKYSDNITGTINLLDLMVKYKVNKIVFSSSAAVYGISKEKIINENTELKPVNYYGFTKAECENIIKWYHQIHGINYLCLRYFNVAGDAGLNYYDPKADNVFPIIMEVLQGKRDKFSIFGNDYPTKDGTCIRDYIDVSDLVDAHLLALEKDYNGEINLGTGNGFSVKELLEEFMKLSGKNIKIEISQRRPGDPAEVIASNEKAIKILGWKPKRTLSDMIKSTLKAYES